MGYINSATKEALIKEFRVREILDRLLGYTTGVTGMGKMFTEMIDSFKLTFLLSIIGMYMAPAALRRIAEKLRLRRPAIAAPSPQVREEVVGDES